MVKLQNPKPVRILNTAAGGGGGGGRRVIAVSSRGDGSGRRRNGGGDGEVGGDGGAARAAARAAGRERAAAARAAAATEENDEGDEGDEGGGAAGDYDGRMVWVNAESTPQSVSHSVLGAAMPGARQGFPVYIFSKYDKNTNVAIKGVVSAQRILAERYGMCVAVSPRFRANRNEVTLKLEPLEGAASPPHVADPAFLAGASSMTVARGTDPKVLAGAIAGQARAGTALTLQAIGAKAVFEMLRAVGVARAYLADDGEGQDLVCFPDFIEVQLEGRDETSNALRLVVVLTA